MVIPAFEFGLNAWNGSPCGNFKADSSHCDLGKRQEPGEALHVASMGPRSRQVPSAINQKVLSPFYQ